jgi:glycosyltransferase involved in cell wall biosynthesis
MLWLLYRFALLFRRRRSSCCAQRAAATLPLRILLTGRVDSKNWCRSHLLPLSKTAAISELILAVDGEVEPFPKARPFVVPRAIGWIKPRAIIRSLWAIRLALRERPDIVMAYSFFPPGVFGLIAARLSGASAYLQLPGGPREIEAGGWAVDDGPFIPEFIKRRLVSLSRKLCGSFDVVIVRGRNAEAYVRQHSTPGRIEIVPGSVEAARFPAGRNSRFIDLVFVGRIAHIKQPEHICQVIRRVAVQRPHLRVVIAGRGEMSDWMKSRVRALGLQKSVRFIGHVEKVEQLLARSRVFLLTSRSEGLSIAMAEAMMAGSVPVVPDVGDLNELVINGKTGWLIEPGNFDAYAERICSLLADEKLWSSFSRNARELALGFNETDAVSARWQKLLTDTPPGALPPLDRLCHPCGVVS